MPDNWQDLAIEKQLRPLIEEPELNWPAPLAYLQQVREKESRQLSSRVRAIVDYEIDQLTDALLAGTFVRTLGEKLYGPEEGLKTDWKSEPLPRPDELLDLIVANSALIE